MKAMYNAQAATVSCEVLKDIGIIHHGSKPTRLRIVSWSGGAPKLDLRTWYTDEDGNERPARGISIALDEVPALSQALNELLAAQKGGGEA